MPTLFKQGTMSSLNGDVVILLFAAVIVVKIVRRDDLANPVSISLERRYSRPSIDLPKYECDNLYDNAKDMVILSQYIYLHAAMVEASQQKPSDGSFWYRNSPSSEIIKNKKAALESVKSVGDIIQLANERTDLFSMKDNGSNVSDSAEVIKKDLNENDHIGRTTDSSIEVIQADPEEVSKSCVYVITKHDEQKRVVVIFRGTSNAGDWVKDALITQRRVRNPASNESNSLNKKIGLHSGFTKALLSSGNVGKILSEVKQILEENPDYKLFITGHSLGGALATLFGFYVAANDDPIYFTNGPVQIFSASSPRVGDKAFREAFKYLEERGKLRHGRIYNARDKVPMLPYLGGFYKHVGLAIKLRPKRVILDYPRYEGWAQSTSVSFINQLTSTFEAVKFHGCQLIRDRLLAAKDELAETTLDLEYKRMWGFLD